MLQLSLHVPSEFSDAVADVVTGSDVTLNITRMRGACTRPDGDAITCTVPREALPELLDGLRVVGFDEHCGSIIIDEHLTVLMAAADDAAQRAAGSPGDALLWPVVRAATSYAAEASFAYYAFMVLATCLAAIGLLTSSSVLIVGAMILGPEFGALAHICVSALARDWRAVGRAHLLLLTGFGTAILVTAALVFVLDASGVAESHALASEFEQTIVAPSWLGFLVACISGCAGVLTLTSAKGEALVGVLVSVTTIPAAADVSIGMVEADATRVVDGLATLLLNLGGMVLAGAGTLLVQRAHAATSR